ncbi:YpjP family protein [Robertmurraya massiliosenegalensis]|uniref:YpjP family protein n=1 Tax=Robertmurraya TaxID=2837507 RepID=UPI0039A6436A
MPKWLRKSFVVLVTVLTFGLVSPSQLYDLVDDKPAKRDTIQSKAQESSPTHKEFTLVHSPSNDDVIDQLLRDAESQSYMKFGERIRPVIEDEFKEIILPNIEQAIQSIAAHYEESQIQNLVISETPTGGDSEKIFHIADREKNEEIIRFHVRKDHPPQAGYWFNFHYHTSVDSFEEHHELGSIYWAKNTPPKWMS